MKILVFGSLNIDHTYHLPHINRPKETISARTYDIAAGGKGLNQAIALAKTGEHVYLAGVLGTGAQLLEETMNRFNVDTSLLNRLPIPSGHAIIQIDDNSENAIFIYAGSNGAVDKEYADKVLSNFEKGDLLIMQNEINLQDYIIKKAHKKGMTILMNPSPCDEKLSEQPLELVDYFFINEVEGELLTGFKKPEEILDGMLKKYPGCHVILTLGSDGACYKYGDEFARVEARKVKAIDTVGAGDTFMGYFIYGLVKGFTPAQCLEIATKASSITVQRKGAAQSIPTLEEVNALD